MEGTPNASASLLRSLDPNTGQPKSKSFVPTKREMENFSENELQHIKDAVANDRERRIDRAIAERQRNALRDLVAPEIDREDTK